MTSQDSSDCESSCLEESEPLKTLSTIHAAGRIVSTMMFSEGLCPKAMIGGEEELVQLYEKEDELIHEHMLSEHQERRREVDQISHLH